LVQHGYNGFLWSPHRNDTLFESVNEIVTNHAVRELCAKNARSTVAHRTWDSVMAELVDHYRSVMTGDKSVSAVVAS
jgi:phosphatidylinositol alpha 1,6-mannosyltransferase